jgi:hypothetical protein
VSSRSLIRRGGIIVGSLAALSLGGLGLLLALFLLWIAAGCSNQARAESAVSAAAGAGATKCREGDSEYVCRVVLHGTTVLSDCRTGGLYGEAIGGISGCKPSHLPGIKARLWDDLVRSFRKVGLEPEIAFPDDREMETVLYGLTKSGYGVKYAAMIFKTRQLATRRADNLAALARIIGEEIPVLRQGSILKRGRIVVWYRGMRTGPLIRAVGRTG